MNGAGAVLDWQQFQFHRLIEVPRAGNAAGNGAGDGGDDGPGRRREASSSLAAALTGSHGALRAAGTPAALATAWVRPPDSREMSVLVGGRPFFPPAGDGADDGADGAAGADGRRSVLFPPGAVATEVKPLDVAALLEAFPCWVPCGIRPDALWAPTGSPSAAITPRRGTFDPYAVHLATPFAWLVVAEPLAPESLVAELNGLVNQILPLTRAEVGEAKRVELERLKSRHRELSRAQVGGAWMVRVLVGGMGPRSTTTAAAMLCAAGELDGLPYVVAPIGQPTSFTAAAGAQARDEYGSRTVFAAGTELLAALTRPPTRELPGLRLVEPRGFDVTPDHAGVGGLTLGTVLDEAGAPTGALAVDHDTLNRHTFVCGATGAGKSQTVRHLLTEATRAGLPWLVIEPAKAEYARMAKRIAAFGGDVVVLRPGDPDQPPAGINPLEPAPGFPLQTHVDLLRALFLAAFESFEPFPQILSAALVRCYEELGWDLALGEPVRRAAGDQATLPYPTLRDLQRVAAAVVSEIGYGDEVAADVQGFIKVRLDSLRLGTTGRVFENGHPLDFDRLRGRNVVLEIEDVGDDADKAFLMGAVLMRLTEHLRVASREGAPPGLTHLTVIEEAHRLLRRPEPGAHGTTAHSVEMFASMLAEVRAYGEGLIIAEQIPSKLIPDVIKNTAVKVLHRLPAQDDRDAVGATINLDGVQSRNLVTLVPGEAAVFTTGMDRPLLVNVADGSEAEQGPGGTFAPVTDVVGRRSPTCGDACRATACTLRQMRTAQHLLADQPWLTLWAELTVLAHLTGHEAPAVEPGQLAELSSDLVDPRELDCALSHAVDDAVAVRAALLQPDVQPADLASHCVAVLRAALAGAHPGTSCADDALGFLAEHYKWLPVWVALDTPGPDDDAPDPATAAWERRFRRRIPGATRTEQRAAVHQWWAAALQDQPARDRVTFGSRRPSTLEALIGGTAGDDDWDSRLPDALRPFPGSDWAHAHLIPFARQTEE